MSTDLKEGGKDTDTNQSWVRYVVVLIQIFFCALLRLSGVLVLEPLKTHLLALLLQLHKASSINHRKVIESKTMTYLT